MHLPHSLLFSSSWALVNSSLVWANSALTWLNFSCKQAIASWGSARDVIYKWASSACFLISVTSSWRESITSSTPI